MERPVSFSAEDIRDEKVLTNSLTFGCNVEIDYLFFAGQSPQVHSVH
jgi:hypothetical protein